ncbi:hypothetical protein DOS79_06640, partial [Staphylococcus felis]
IKLDFLVQLLGCTSVKCEGQVAFYINRSYINKSKIKSNVSIIRNIAHVVLLKLLEEIGFTLYLVSL